MNSEAIDIQVVLFSVLREATGKSDMHVRLVKGARGSVLLDHLCEEHASLSPYRDHIKLAVNESYAAEETVLEDGDQVALITPVSGG